MHEKQANCTRAEKKCGFYMQSAGENVAARVFTRENHAKSRNEKD